MTDQPSAAVHYDLTERTALITLDDGKANALSQSLIAALEAALDRAEQEADVLIITGRPGRFSGGFDLSVMNQGGEVITGLVRAGAELALRLYAFPRPVVMACSGHAVAMGAFLVLCGDVRLGAAGSFKIGFNEVANGMIVPTFGLELARDRLAPNHLTRATLGAVFHTPEEAVEVGIFDRVVSADALLDEARAEASRLTGLNAIAFARTKDRLRGDTIARVRASLTDDMQRLARGR